MWPETELLYPEDMVYVVFSGQGSGCRGGQEKSGRGVQGLFRWIRSNPKSLKNESEKVKMHNSC